MIRLCHDVTGASALVSEDTARLWLALPQDAFVSCAQLSTRLGPALRELCSLEELAACLDALVAGGLIETPEARIPLGYDNVAALYDARPPPDPALFEILWEHTSAEHWQDVLEIGVGTGQVLEQLARSGPGSLSGIDLSSGMLEQAAARCERLGIAANLQQARAEALPFQDDALSMVVMSSSLWWFDLPRFWREVYRVLRENGRAVVLTTGPDEPFYDLFEAFRIRKRQGSDWDAGTIVHDLPAFVGLLHFATTRGTMQLADKKQAIDLANSLAPRGSADAPFTPIDDFDASQLDWPLCLPTVSSLAVLRMFPL